MNRRRFVAALGSGIAATLPLPIHMSARPPVRSSGHLIERWSWAMGQPVHLQLFAPSDAQGYDAAAAALAELRRVESRLSLFDDASDLCELNRHAGRARFRADRDLLQVLRGALRLERLSGGAFDVAVEPLMRVWGFHQSRTTAPTSAELREARAAVQSARIVIEDEWIRLPSRHTRLDLGGIGVGYGLDRAISVLRDAGIHSAFLDISGDCFALGTPPDTSDGWLVELAVPHPGKPPVASTRIRDAALATSSNSVSVVHYGRAVRGHVMNPETGWPAGLLTQVTVVARSGVEADALSTGMLVSGKPAPGVIRYYKM
jgi:thiamine biosynthesis lipoprotein